MSPKEKGLYDECLQVSNILEAGRVRRFHATPRVIGQSVGEHVYGVVAIGHYISRKPSADFMLACLLHDAAELHTGDIPFTAKRGCFQHLKLQMEAAEEQIMEDHFWPMPELTRREELILKLADMLEGMRYVSHSEIGEPIIADRWWHALQEMFLKKELRDTLGEDELERAHMLFRIFSPHIHNHRVSNSFQDLLFRNNIKHTYHGQEN